MGFEVCRNTKLVSSSLRAHRAGPRGGGRAKAGPRLAVTIIDRFRICSRVATSPRCGRSLVERATGIVDEMSVFADPERCVLSLLSSFRVAQNGTNVCDTKAGHPTLNNTGSANDRA
jgi:hypothetical protein